MGTPPQSWATSGTIGQCRRPAKPYAQRRTKVPRLQPGFVRRESWLESN